MPYTQYRPGNDKHFGRHSQHQPFAFELYGRRNDGVGKARDGYQSTRARVLGNIVVHIKAGENSAQGNQRYGAKQPRVLQLHTGDRGQFHDHLTQGADQSAHQKRPYAVFSAPATAGTPVYSSACTPDP